MSITRASPQGRENCQAFSLGVAYTRDSSQPKRYSLDPCYGCIRLELRAAAFTFSPSLGIATTFFRISPQNQEGYNSNTPYSIRGTSSNRNKSPIWSSGSGHTRVRCVYHCLAISQCLWPSPLTHLSPKIVWRIACQSKAQRLRVASRSHY